MSADKVVSAGSAAGEQSNIESGLIKQIIDNIIYSPINLLLTLAILYLLYKILKGDSSSVGEEVVVPPSLPKIRKDMTVSELKVYDGHGADGRVMIACNGFIFDVTRGKQFYGPGGPYAAFAGRDASRGLATFAVVPSEKEWDDLSDLSTSEMESVKEWEEQFRYKYDLVGKLLQPGETPTDYTQEEEEDTKKEI